MRTIVGWAFLGLAFVCYTSRLGQYVVTTCPGAQGWGSFDSSGNWVTQWNVRPSAPPANPYVPGSDRWAEHELGLAPGSMELPAFGSGGGDDDE